MRPIYRYGFFLNHGHGNHSQPGARAELAACGQNLARKARSPTFPGPYHGVHLRFSIRTYVRVCRARDTYVKDRLARPVLRLEGVVFRPKVSRALRESSATRPERSTDRLPP